jgi:hypothetical protein
MTLSDAIASILGPKTAHGITMAQGEHWAFVAAVAAANTDDDPEALKAIRAHLAAIKANAK